MDLILFAFFLIITFILITLGLFRPEHTELCIVGFIFLFLLSLTLLGNGLTHVTGTNTTSTFNYSIVGNNTLLTNSFEEVQNNYTTVSLENNLSHFIGYWLMIVAIIGFAGSLMGLRHSPGFR
jgi:hypothetical protein